MRRFPLLFAIMFLLPVFFIPAQQTGGAGVSGNGDTEMTEEDADEDQDAEAEIE